MAAEASAGPSTAEIMGRDAVLPADIVPERRAAPGCNAVLVTGATGFLGRYVVGELLKRRGLGIFCLVRATDAAAARARLRKALESAGIDWSANEQRLHVLAGAIDQPQLGLTAADYQCLSDGVAAIYHCAANVNWALGYRRLRASNVHGTVELIRLACRGPVKRIYFSSTIAVCFARSGPQEIDENKDMLPYVGQMPLPYAQSKSVAESLLRDASARGVPVSIVRPALISGHSESGDANHNDLICALIQGCVASGAATDSDWRLDFVPVDFVARVLAALGDACRPDWEVLNLFHEQRRHWRELVLWLNLYGYPVALVPHAEWLRRTFDRSTAPPSLVGYRRFFGATSRRFTGPAPYETYLEHAQGRVRNESTRRVLEQLDIRPPALNAPLIERYLNHYQAARILPPSSRRRPMTDAHCRAASILRATIRNELGRRNLELTDVRERPFASGNSIFNEIASARVGGDVGIRRYDARVLCRSTNEPGTLELLLKCKPADTVMEDILVEVATLCDAELGAHFDRFRHDLGLAGCHERELGLYQLPEPRLRQHMPLAFGTNRDPAGGTWSIAMEYLSGAEKVDATAAWSESELYTVLRGLADVHAIWYRREGELAQFPWIVPPPDTKHMLKMTPLWKALAKHSSRFFSAWLAEPVLAAQNRLIATLGDWWPALRALPQTLIHNDFNPRNFVPSAADAENSPIIFDWELATVGPPQHDLAELLCFALPRGSGAPEVTRMLETYRKLLTAATGVSIDRDQWHAGFLLSLRYLIIYRLPLYTLAHRFKRQAFLPRVLRNWVDLYAAATVQASSAAAGADLRPGPR